MMDVHQTCVMQFDEKSKENVMNDVDGLSRVN